jgi:hypothetical protein
MDNTNQVCKQINTHMDIHLLARRLQMVIDTKIKLALFICTESLHVGFGDNIMFWLFIPTIF